MGVDASTAFEFTTKFEGYNKWTTGSKKEIEVVWGDLRQQGLEYLIDHYKNSELMHEETPELFRPVLLEDGKPKPFPRYDQLSKKPRIKLSVMEKYRAIQPT